jgi:hypothetical protein
MKKLINFGIENPEKLEEGIPTGKIRCFIKGILRNDAPEERVRQEVTESLVEEYGHKKEDIEIEFPIRVRRHLKRVRYNLLYYSRILERHLIPSNMILELKKLSSSEAKRCLGPILYFTTLKTFPNLG